MQPDCLKGWVVCRTVYGNMHLKDRLGSFAKLGYCFPVHDFYLVLLMPKKHYDGLMNHSSLLDGADVICDGVKPSEPGVLERERHVEALCTFLQVNVFISMEVPPNIDSYVTAVRAHLVDPTRKPDDEVCLGLTLL